jgi:hypothetical protein
MLIRKPARAAVGDVSESSMGVINPSNPSLDDDVECNSDGGTPFISDRTETEPATIDRSPVSDYSFDDSSLTSAPTGTEASAAFLVTNWLVAEGEL